ncbi:MAG: hypothetical protein B7733_17005 [Myxococcales bacterium FL481]|nr:MAG: hypothetical protein B7733_17005 [Myxococcales bacterium FL481]
MLDETYSTQLAAGIRVARCGPVVTLSRLRKPVLIDMAEDACRLLIRGLRAQRDAVACIRFYDDTTGEAVFAWSDYGTGAYTLYAGTATLTVPADDRNVLADELAANL